MNRKRWFVAAVIPCVVACGGCLGPTRQTDAPLAYPRPALGSVADNYHGVQIRDPYRWMEDLDSPEVKAWIEEENKLTFAYLAQIPARGPIRERLTKLWDYERYGVPDKRGSRYFFTKNDGLQNQSVLYVAESLDAAPRVLLDPNKLSADGTVALAGLNISDDGKLAAYGTSAAGSDWVEYRVRNVDTGEDLPDQVKWIKFSEVSWTRDGKGFFYSRYDQPADPSKLESVNYFQKLYHHRLGTAQEKDRLIYHRPDQKEWGFGGRVSDDGRYLVISVWQGTERKNRIYYVDLQAEARDVVKLLDDFDARYEFIDNDGPVFWFLTDLNAPRARVIAIDTRNPARAGWSEIIPQAPETLEGVSCVGGMFIASYLKDARSQVRVFDLTGKFVREVVLPGLGTAAGFSGKRADAETFYRYTSFGDPGTVYRYDVRSGDSTVFRRPRVDFNPDDFEATQVFYTGKDGTRVPMFITHKKGVKLDGNNPTCLYGYGGFGISLTPRFSVGTLVWMELGGVYAMPNIRGGGEYGTAWHDAGRLKNKQNGFDDFIAAAEWLVAHKYTRPGRLAIAGSSNGGLLIGACMTQRPDLFGAALPDVGVLDMLRFHKYTIGWAWTSDYGSADDPAMFPVLRAYSPLHNIRPGTKYPATLVTTADHDDRVVPSHSFKFAAALQAAQAGPKPILIRVETRAGHGSGKPTSKIIEERADAWAFLVRALDMNVSAFMSREASR